MTIRSANRIVAIELNHKSAPVEIREKISASIDRIQAKLERLKTSVPEIFVVSTCNRFSVYGYCRNETLIIEVLQSVCNKIKTKHLTIFYDELAVNHLFATAAGLESQIVGEHEILGQIRNAFILSNQRKNVGPILNELVNKALHTGKRVRTETLIGKHAVSLAAITSNKIKENFRDAQFTSIVVYGTGEMAEIILKMLNKIHAACIFVVSKDIARASWLAKRYHATPISYDRAMTVMPLVDVLIGATRTKSFVLTKTDLLNRSASNPGLIIDFGMPRNFDPEINSIGGINLYDLESFKNVASKSIEKRKKEIIHANSIIKDEVSKYLQWLEFRNYVPMIQEFKGRLEYVKKNALKRVIEKTPNLSEERLGTIEEAANTLVKKTLSQVITSYRKLNDSQVVKHNAKKIKYPNQDALVNDFSNGIDFVIKRESKAVAFQIIHPTSL